MHVAEAFNDWYTGNMGIGSAWFEMCPLLASSLLTSGIMASMVKFMLLKDSPSQCEQ